MLVGKPPDDCSQLPQSLSLGNSNKAPACDNRQTPRPVERLERTMPDLPSGTVTILFTDIEGSTALWERDRRARAEVVVRHLALLRQAMKAHHGVLYAVVGDAVQATFVTASDGL